MVDQEAKPTEKKGFFEKMSLFQKGLLFVGILIVLVMSVSILLGGVKDFYQFFFYIIVFSAVIVGGYVVIKATSMIFTPRYFSPREDLRTKLVNMAQDYKPDNVNNLYFIGDVGKKRVKAGKIIGLIGLPYYTGKAKKNAKGEIEYTSVKDFQGKPIPKYEDIKLGDDGDTMFIIKGDSFLGLFGKTHLIRCLGVVLMISRRK